MLKKLALVASALAVPGAAHAAGRGITYDCDTAPGHFSELVLPAPSTAFTVTGNIKVNNIAKDKKWAPIARVRIGSAPAGPGAAPSAFGGFELTALPGKSVSLLLDTVQALSFDASGRDTEIIAASLQSTGAVQSFRLAYDGRSVAVTIGTETRSYPLTTSEPVVQVICSTGEFLMTDLRVEPSS